MSPLRPLLAALLLAGPVLAQAKYQKPPPAVQAVLDAPAAPAASLSPDRAALLIATSERYPPIADLAQPVLRLAGVRLNPRTGGPQLPPRYTTFTLLSLADGSKAPIHLPEGARPSLPVWSPDSKRFALLNTRADGIELWLGDRATGKLRQVKGLRINAAFGEPLHWFPGSDRLLCQAIVPDRGKPPAAPEVPSAPTVQESAGRAGPVRTFQDLLKNSHDEDLFDYHATSQLVLVDATGKFTAVGKPAVFARTVPSPDGAHLLVTRLRRPYSYVLPAFAFPRTIEVWDVAGKVEHVVAELPLADRVPIEGVPTGPRNVAWRPTAKATLEWVEALDGGDPRKKVPHRDKLMTLAAPFDSKPEERLRTEQRLMGISHGAGDLALVSDYARNTRRRRTYLVHLDDKDSKPRLLWDLSIQDRYRSPGTPLMRRQPNGATVLWQDGDDLFLAGPGASPKGDRPFLDRFNLETGKATRLFQSDEKSLESVVALLDAKGPRFLTRHESPTSPPNYLLHEGKGQKAITHFKDPTPQLRGITRRLVTYKRPDGVPLSFTLYLPPGYKPGTRLPTVVWAYPREFTDAGVAGQVSGSPNAFTTIAGSSHLFFVLHGYAVLDGAAMPVVGSAEKANDTFVDQVVASAKAAIDKAVELGVTDPERVGVGGHSYGAFMTANLLAHSDLFRAGIARSGAYNRTLTPFGFQNERRTLWEAPEVYAKMSPFMHANKIKDAILLIHGEADNNPGTFPVQSERLYQAVRGHGGTVRYVRLPHESHGYAARESVEHTLYEMLGWFDKHVKDAAPRKK
jgi:dipeptidyl aminopeptidase/acylaminoacyl peptidase